MTTWNSKPALLGLALLTLSACEDGRTAGLLDGLSSTLSGTEAVALSQTQMADGALTLVPPNGFCIDRKTLRQNFALMARCDMLGAPNHAGGAPLRVITVSVSELATEAALPTPQHIADAAKLARFDAEEPKENTLTFRAEGAPPAAGLDVAHWRGVARMGDHVMGVALYGPKGAPITSSEGHDIISDLFHHSHPGT